MLSYLEYAPTITRLDCLTPMARPTGHSPTSCGVAGPPQVVLFVAIYKHMVGCSIFSTNTHTHTHTHTLSLTSLSLSLFPCLSAVLQKLP